MFDPVDTIIDVLRISGATPTCLKHIVWSGNPPTSPIAGRASDVAITPDGAFAVVHCRNYIIVVPLGNDAADQHIIFDISPVPAGVEPLATVGTYPGPQSDSVAVTDTHAVVVTTRDNETAAGVRFPRTWAYVVDLTLDPPQIVLEEYLSANSGVSDGRPHDVTISPNGNLAVVAMNQSVALINLRGTPSLVSKQAQSGFTRSYSLLPTPVDSVEATNTHAVFLSVEGNVGSGGPEGWVIHSAKLVDPIGAPLLTFLGSPFKATQFTGFEGPDWPHDLAIWTDGVKTLAVVKTQDTDVALSIVNDQPSLLGRFVNYAAPYHPQSLVFTSDSVVMGVPWPSATALHYATTIGAKFNPTTSKYETVATAVSLGDQFGFLTLTGGDPAFDTFPSDIALGRTTRDAVVRCMAPPDETNPALGGRDFFRFVTIVPPFNEQVRYGGTGNRIHAVDSMVYGVNAAVSVSEFLESSEPLPGRIHFTAPVFQ